MTQFNDMFIRRFWNDNDPDADLYMDDPAGSIQVAQVEKELDYQLPESYVRLMRNHNGGIPYNTCFPLPDGNYIEISGFFSIGKQMSNSLCGSAGNKLFKQSWGYPDYGVYIADTDTEDMDLILLDYRQCGPDGEPAVACVNAERQTVMLLAPDFETFVLQLKELEEVEMNRDAIDMVENDDFSPLLIRICRHCGLPQAESWFRAVARQIVDEQQQFILGNDPTSYLMYDLQYMLYTFAFPKAPVTQYLQEYPLILAEDGDFTTNGYDAESVAKWMEGRVREGKLKVAGQMIGQKNCMVFTTEAMTEIVEGCNALMKKWPL